MESRVAASLSDLFQRDQRPLQRVLHSTGRVEFARVETPQKLAQDHDRRLVYFGHDVTMSPL